MDTAGFTHSSHCKNWLVGQPAELPVRWAELSWWQQPFKSRWEQEGEEKIKCSERFLREDKNIWRFLCKNGSKI